jgi:uncharacterized protein Yka (UPF0111/DUF47 family)
VSLGTNYARSPTLIATWALNYKMAIAHGDQDEAARLLEKIKTTDRWADSTKAKYLRDIERWEKQRIA